MAEQEARSPHTTEAEYWKSAAHACLGRAARAAGPRARRPGRGDPGPSRTTVGRARARHRLRQWHPQSLELAARVGPDGYVLGADISGNPWREPVNASPPIGLPQAEVICADASSHPFAPGSLDLAFSRLGVMFFSNPVAAFAEYPPGDEAGGTLGFSGVPQTRGKSVAKRPARRRAPPAAATDHRGAGGAGHVLVG